MDNILSLVIDRYIKLKYMRSEKEDDRYLIESSLLSTIAAKQLNTPKNKIKPPLENEHPIKLIERTCGELTELLKEFNTEKEIDFIRVLEELGDTTAYLVGILKWVIDDHLSNKVEN